MPFIGPPWAVEDTATVASHIGLATSPTADLRPRQGAHPPGVVSRGWIIRFSWSASLAKFAGIIFSKRGDCDDCEEGRTVNVTIFFSDTAFYPSCRREQGPEGDGV
jgi:hypothetical protein